VHLSGDRDNTTGIAMSAPATPPASSKPKVALYWAASCGGCEIAMLDLDDKILDVITAVDLIFWPVALDTKYHDIEQMPDHSIDICLFNGAIRTTENEHLAKLLRKKSKTLIAFGACAVSGGIPGLANLTTKQDILTTAYLDNPSTPNPHKTLPQPSSKAPEGTLTIPELHETVKTLNQVVDVDYYLPGCPPPTNLILDALTAITTGKLPEKGSILAPMKSVCDDCRFKISDKKITTIKRLYELDTIQDTCFLEQNVICLGPATRSGCKARCMDANSPCTGCGGPLPNALDQGAGMITALASILGIETEDKTTDADLDILLAKILDLAGTFYKYSLPGSLLHRRRTP
jgi:F420-non-reducing hydrogenase small subunit